MVLAFNSNLIKTFFVKSIILFFVIEFNPTLAQSNSSNVTNQAAPSASSITSGGFNYNYQSNNTFNNDIGFGPGLVCRTPVLYVGGNYGDGYIRNNGLSVSTNTNKNYGAQVGLAVPFGSSILEDCKSIARHVALDRQISTELSMIRACASLVKEGITVDPVKFPFLAKCVLKPGETPFVAGLPVYNPDGLPAAQSKNNKTDKSGNLNNIFPPKKPKVTVE